jgi:LacI family transcriptional regulator
MNVNIKWLAKELNLSIATVSRALQDSHMVSDETKRRVLELAKKANYRANPYASSLRRQKSKTIAVVIPEIANNFFSLAINGIDEVAQKNNYHILIYLTHDSLEREISITQHLLNGRVDGVLISVSSETNTYEHLVELKINNIPIVFFDRVCNEIDTVTITTDDYQSGFNATEHLIQNGCTRVAYLQISKNLSIGQKRFKGYLDALHKYNIQQDERLVILGTNDTNENYVHIKQLLASKKRPDGIFASVESLAITVYYVCEELKLRIPEDVKVISFSNLTTAPLLSPPLTTITQPAFAIGKEAATSLFQILKNNKGLIRRNIVLASTLIQRASTRNQRDTQSSV